MKPLHIKILLLLLFSSIFFRATAQVKSRLIENWEFLKQDLGGVWESVRPVGAGAPESVPLWQKVNIPHCFNAIDAVDPELNYYQGPGWYRTFLDINNPYHKGRTILHFEGAGQKTDVYIYTTKVGSHVGGYDEWTVDITDAVEAFQKTNIATQQFNGKIPLSIRCDNSRDLEMIPSDLSDFTIYGGIYRYLNIQYRPALSLDKVFIRTSMGKDRNAASIQVKARFYNPYKVESASGKIRLIHPNGRQILTYNIKPENSEENIELKTFKLKKPILWSPDTPHLYTLEVVIGTGDNAFRYSEKLGFRSFEFKEQGPFILNGKRLLLKGTHRHEDHAGTGAAMTESLIRKEMIMMKEMGVNFIRLGHYQQSRIVLSLCDSLGILVWEEIPWCRGGLGGEIYKEQARRMLANMIEQHFNHPSIIIWGLGNENDWPGDFSVFDKEQIRTFMKSLNELAHQLDPSRKTAIRRCDFCKDIVDVYSPSIWAGWYRGQYKEYKEVSEREFKKVKHFLHVEWGGDSHARRHSEDYSKVIGKIRTGKGADERQGDASLVGGESRVSKDGDWSETYICDLIDWHLKEQETMPWLSGTAYWPFKDFATPVRPENPVPYVNQKGVVERDFTKKESYFVFQSYWTDTPMIHIYGHSWPIRWGEEGEEKVMKVYSNCEKAELFLNGNSQGIKMRNTQDFPAAGFHWNLAFKKGQNTIKVIGTKGKVKVEDEITFQYQTEKWDKPSRITLQKVNEDGDIITVEARLLDSKNLMCLDAKNRVSFSVIGNGTLLDNLGTSSGSNLVEVYNGRALIKVRKTSGKCVVGVQSEGIGTELLEL